MEPRDLILSYASLPNPEAFLPEVAPPEERGEDDEAGLDPGEDEDGDAGDLGVDPRRLVGEGDEQTSVEGEEGEHGDGADPCLWNMEHGTWNSCWNTLRQPVLCGHIRTLFRGSGNGQI